MAQPCESGMQGGGVRFTATEMETRAAIETTIDQLAVHGLCSDVLSSVEIALAEVANNVVEHAYGDMGPGPAGIDFDLDGFDLWISVWDCGRGFPGHELPEGQPVDLSGSPNDIPEGGYGWFLIRSLAAEVSYNCQGGRNRLTLRFDLSAPT